MWEIITIIGLVLCCCLAVALTALRLPGTWLLIAIMLGYGWLSDWRGVGLLMVAVLCGLALIGEAVELLASVFTAKKAGASRQAAWGGLAGGLVGMIFLSFLIPVPLVGTLVGALLGCFLGAALAELAMRKKLAQGTKVGFFSALGFALGAAAKVAIALAMSAVLLTSVVCSEPPSGNLGDEPSLVGPSANGDVVDNP
ncbi:MAG: DUF456 domain-containing protein [Phycisphaerales bacterium]|nr:MAG: DUF456 domain-containing protein [Phycisphaerales bacterium]